MEKIFALGEISDVAQSIIRWNPPRVLLFHGEMGAGKTTLIKALAQALGVNDTTASPTFSLVNEYETPSGNIYHFDVYRLKSQTEALDMGIEEYLYSGHWCFIEWAEKIPDLIPDEHANVTLSVLPDGRRKVIVSR